MVALFVIFMPTTAFISHIWANLVALEVWVIYWVILLVTAAVLVSIMRRTFVEVGADRVRWFFRQPGAGGDEPLANLTKVKVIRSGAILVFKNQLVAVGISDFSHRNIDRLVETLRSLGVQIEPG